VSSAIIQEAWRAARDLPQLELIHIKRDRNGAAHELAQCGIIMSMFVLST